MGRSESKRYYELAAQKRQMADNTHDAKLKDSYQELANTYEKLAATIQRIEDIERGTSR